MAYDSVRIVENRDGFPMVLDLGNRAGFVAAEPARSLPLFGLLPWSMYGRGVFGAREWNEFEK